MRIGEGLRISVVRYDKPLPAMPVDDPEATPVEGMNGWMHGVEDGSGSWVETRVEEANCECCILQRRRRPYMGSREGRAGDVRELCSPPFSVSTVTRLVAQLALFAVGADAHRLIILFVLQ